MRLSSTLLFAVLLLGLPMAASAEEASLAFGGDQYAAGQVTTIGSPVARDAFMVGNEVTLSAPVTGDAHLAGFDVNVNADVAADLYAAGFSVTVGGAVGGDITATGNSIVLKAVAPVAGNVRLAGANVTIDTPVTGSALISAQTLTLNTAIAGDFSFYGENIIFGPGARIDGALQIRAPKAITVPPSVASADRVTFEQLVSPDYVSEAGKTAEHAVNRFWPVFWTVVGWWLVLFLVGAALIALAPRTTTALSGAAGTRPFRNLGLGILSFASVLGLVPVLAMTFVGLLLVPFALLFAVIACSLAYLAGAFLIGERIAKGFMTVDSNPRRLIVLAVALVAAAVLGAIPIIGWLLTLAILVFGFGAFAVVTMARWNARDARAIAAAAPAA